MLTGKTGKISVKYTYKFMYNIDDVIYKIFESYNDLFYYIENTFKNRFIFLLEIKEI